jgi:hypothetical protein
MVRTLNVMILFIEYAFGSFNKGISIHHSTHNRGKNKFHGSLEHVLLCGTKTNNLVHFPLISKNVLGH